jgi:Uma2 family endonuclease
MNLRAQRERVDSRDANQARPEYDLAVTAAKPQEYVPYDVFLRDEASNDDRHEWVDGVVYAMSRGSPEHGRLAGRVTARMLSPFLEDGCEIFSSDTAIFIEAAQHHTYADASLVCGALCTRMVYDKNGKSIGEAIVNPTLIVEVLSDATERYDRDGKFEAYKKLPSFEAYVLVSQTERRIEVRTREGQQWQTQIGSTGQTIRVHGRQFAVDAIYA